jgi:hypothetical protein
VSLTPTGTGRTDVHVSTPPTAQTLSGRFAAMIAPRRRTDRVTEDAEFLAVVFRFVRALEARAIENPELITGILALQERLREVPDVVIAVCAERYAQDQHWAPSMMEIARLIGVSKQAASQRRARGVSVMDARLAAAGVVRFSEAKREREIIEESTTAAVIGLAEYKARHLRVA